MNYVAKINKSFLMPMCVRLFPIRPTFLLVERAEHSDPNLNSCIKVPLCRI